jgi:hypothetical protein
MIIAATTFAPNLALTVSALCALALAFLAFRWRGRAKLSSAAPDSTEKRKDSFARLAAEAGHPPKQVIRLPSTPGPVSSAEMTQQEKIAAALQRAGISNSVWSVSDEAGQSDSGDPGPENKK